MSNRVLYLIASAVTLSFFITYFLLRVMNSILLVILLHFAIQIIVGYMEALSFDDSDDRMDYCMSHCSHRSPDVAPYDHKLCYTDNVNDSIAHHFYSRMPLASERRQSHNDIYIKRRLEGRHQFYEFGFEQDYLLCCTTALTLSSLTPMN